MDIKTDPNWLNQIVNYIREYTGKNPGYSLSQLAWELQQKFMLKPEEAEKLAALADKELNMGKPGLAAVELNLTFNCNLTCEYCFVHCKSPHDRMSFETACRAIDILMERAVFPEVVITLIGGEPLLEFELIKKIVPYALEQANKHNLKINWAITTNGTLISQEILQYFSEHKINTLISIDGAKETHDRYRKTRSGEGSWQKIADLIPLIKQYQPWLGARMTVSTEAITTMLKGSLL